jgi:hypothetical protein
VDEPCVLKKDEKKPKEPERHQLSLIRYIYETEQPLPFCTTRSLCVKDKEKKVEYTPPEVSVMDLQKRITEIENATNPFDYKVIQLLLTGAIAPQVNAGMYN